MAPEPHAHDFDELIGIIGYPEKRGSERAVGGEVSIMMGQEKYAFKQSSMLFVPGNVVHCPLEFKNIRRPVLCFTAGYTTNWEVQPKTPAKEAAE